MQANNYRVREACLICDGSGKSSGALCTYCEGHGTVFARTGAPAQIMLASGDCKAPMRLKSTDGGLSLSRRNT